MEKEGIMPNGGPCPRTVTIRITQGQVTAQPNRVHIDRVCQVIQWNLVTDGSGSFSNPPISFPWPAPPHDPPYTQWPSATTLVQTGPMQWEANVNSPVNTMVIYKYDVNWSGGVFDPEAENDPYPPGEDEDKEKDKDKKP
jgi:hypothetical protein